MEKETKVILTPSFPAAVYEALQAQKDGWELDESEIPTTFGFNYEIIMCRNKLTRAEILAKARAAKAAKKEAGEEGEE